MYPLGSWEIRINGSLVGLIRPGESLRLSLDESSNALTLLLEVTVNGHRQIFVVDSKRTAIVIKPCVTFIEALIAIAFGVALLLTKEFLLFLLLVFLVLFFMNKLELEYP